MEGDGGLLGGVGRLHESEHGGEVAGAVHAGQEAELAAVGHSTVDGAQLVGGAGLPEQGPVHHGHHRRDHAGHHHSHHHHQRKRRRIQHLHFDFQTAIYLFIEIERFFPILVHVKLLIREYIFRVIINILLDKRKKRNILDCV